MSDLSLLEETLKLMKAPYSPDHPSILSTMNNLAGRHWSLKQLDKSVPLFEELLPLREKKLGRAHPSTQMAVANQGVNYKDAGRVAIPLLVEAYEPEEVQKWQAERAKYPMPLEAAPTLKEQK